jgi:hypothetical protein
MNVKIYGSEENSCCDQNKSLFFIPKIKLVGYGRSQTYQLVCLKCKNLYFNLKRERNFQDLFCDWCDTDEKYLGNDNFSEVNYVGIIIGWVVKTDCNVKKFSTMNYKKVYKRDGYVCQYCNYSLRTSTEFRALHIDHIKPRAASGSNRMDNLVVSCCTCNLIASDRWFNTFLEKKEFILSKRIK